VEFVATSLPGCFRVVPPPLPDARGRLVRIFSAGEFAARGLESAFCEQFYTVSRKGVLRGLHFQAPPHDHAKLVACVAGEVLDAVLDLRAGSPAFGRHELFRLASSDPFGIYLPRGVAHGFYVPGEEATVLYGVTSPHAPSHDLGVLWDSAGIPWPDRSPILSPRDRSFPTLADLATPFRFEGRS